MRREHLLLFSYLFLELCLYILRNSPKVLADFCKEYLDVSKFAESRNELNTLLVITGDHQHDLDCDIDSFSKGSEETNLNPRLRREGSVQQGRCRLWARHKNCRTFCTAMGNSRLWTCFLLLFIYLYIVFNFMHID